MTRREKTMTLALLWLGIVASMAVSVESFWSRALLAVIAAAVTVHVVRIKAAVTLPAPARDAAP